MDLNSRRITAILENALLEDRATRDATSYACIDPNQRASATILAKQDCILAGIGCVARIFDVYAALDGAVTSHYEVTTHPEIFDGVRLHKGQSVAVIRHNARVILSCERVILNFLQRMSGIATVTRKFVDAVSGTQRAHSRYSQNRARPARHRQVRRPLRRRTESSPRSFRRSAHQEQPHRARRRGRSRARSRRAQPPRLAAHRDRSPHLDELEEALAHGAEAILLDNMPPEEVRRAVDRCSKLDRRIPIECSGGIRLENVRAYAETGVDFISIGLLTHSPQAVDLSMRAVPV